MDEHDALGARLLADILMDESNLHHPPPPPALTPPSPRPQRQARPPGAAHHDAAAAGSVEDLLPPPWRRPPLPPPPHCTARLLPRPATRPQPLAARLPHLLLLPLHPHQGRLLCHDGRHHQWLDWGAQVPGRAKDHQRGQHRCARPHPTTQPPTFSLPITSHSPHPSKTPHKIRRGPAGREACLAGRRRQPQGH